MPELSVIVPVYNVEPYLATCLDSLIQQTLQDIEIICVDDGSTDSCPAILARYAASEPRIKVITQANKGLSGARNSGLRVATAPYVAFVDSDDYMEPDAYAKALSHMRDDIDCVCYGVQVRGNDPWDIQSAFTHKYSGGVDISDKVLLDTDTSACNKIFRMDRIRQWELLFPEGLKVEDIYFTQLYGLRSRKICFIEDRLYNYVRRETSIIHEIRSGSTNGCLNYLYIFERVLAYAKEHGLWEARRSFFTKFFIRQICTAFYVASTPQEYRRIFDFANDLSHRADYDLSDPEDAFFMAKLRHHFYSGITVPHCGGLVKSYHGAQNIKVRLGSFPLMRIKFNATHKEYCLFGFIPLRKVRLVEA